MRPFLIAAPLVMIGALAILAIVTLFQPPGRRVAVVSALGVDAAIAAIIRAGGSIAEIRPHAVIAVSDHPDFVSRLYGRAWLLVLGATEGGCGFGRVDGPGYPDRTAAAYLR